MNNHIVYVIYNSEVDKFYIGQTADLQQRLMYHNSKFFHNSFTSRFEGTWKIVYTETFISRSEALAREKQLKSGGGRRFIREEILR